jgi:hypothetical protein
MQSEENDLRQRTKEFGLQIVRMFSGLPKTAEAQVLGRQVLPSSFLIFRQFFLHPFSPLHNSSFLIHPFPR